MRVRAIIEFEVEDLDDDQRRELAADYTFGDESNYNLPTKEAYSAEECAEMIVETEPDYSGSDFYAKLINPKLVSAEFIEKEPKEDSELTLLEILLQYGSIDGAHHKMWAIDQAVRKLTGDKYEETIREYCDGEDGRNTYEWDEGIAP